MTTPSAFTKPGPVVVGFDGSPVADVALRWAAAEAARRQVALQVLHVLGRFEGLRRSDSAALEEHGGRLCDEAASEVRHQYPDLDVTTDIRAGRAAAELIDASDQAGLIVVGARGRGRFAGTLIGSVSQQVTTYARCPVVVVRRSEPRDEGPVVVGVDGSAESTVALQFALGHAAAAGAPVRVVHAEYVEPPVGAPPGGWYETLAEQAREQSAEVRASVEETVRDFPAVDVEIAVNEQHPVGMLLEGSEDARLIVVGSRGREGFAGLRLGSVSQAVVSNATVPVAVVPGGAGG